MTELKQQKIKNDYNKVANRISSSNNYESLLILAKISELALSKILLTRILSDLQITPNTKAK